MKNIVTICFDEEIDHFYVADVCRGVSIILNKNFVQFLLLNNVYNLLLHYNDINGIEYIQ